MPGRWHSARRVCSLVVPQVQVAIVRALLDRLVLLVVIPARVTRRVGMSMRNSRC